MLQFPLQVLTEPGRGLQEGRGETEWGEDREGKRRLRKKRKEGKGEKGGGRE
jgi:hypothetical protein